MKEKATFHWSTHATSVSLLTPSLTLTLCFCQCPVEPTRMGPPHSVSTSLLLVSVKQIMAPYE